MRGVEIRAAMRPHVFRAHNFIRVLAQFTSPEA